MSMADTIRRAIDQSGESRYAISQATGIAESTLSRFYNGVGDLKLETADMICQHLGLELRPRATTRKVTKQ